MLEIAFHFVLLEMSRSWLVVGANIIIQIQNFTGIDKNLIPT